MRKFLSICFLLISLNLLDKPANSMQDAITSVINSSDVLNAPIESGYILTCSTGPAVVSGDKIYMTSDAFGELSMQERNFIAQKTKGANVKLVSQRRLQQLQQSVRMNSNTPRRSR